MAERHEIKAVHKNNLEEMLKGLEMLENVKEGRINCKFCGKTITLGNLGCLYPKNNEISFCCNDIECFMKAIQDSGSV
jgi:hypothetical protein